MVTATVLDYHCGDDSHLGYLGGVTTVRAFEGVITFSNLNAYCFPGGNMTVGFTSQQARAPGYSTVVAKVTLTFRDCRDGEILVNNQCEECPPGSYSLHYDPDGKCIPCPENTDGCFGSSIAVLPGYWRISPDSTVMMQCPMPDACLGGDGGTCSDSSKCATPSTNAVMVENRISRRVTDSIGFDSGCAIGYSGPLCAVCSSGFYLDVLAQVFCYI